jgi:hypothetical protein
MSASSTPRTVFSVPRMPVLRPAANGGGDVHESFGRFLVRGLTRPGLRWTAAEPDENLVKSLHSANEDLVAQCKGLATGGPLSVSQSSLHRVLFNTCIIGLEECDSSWSLNLYLWTSWSLFLDKLVAHELYGATVIQATCLQVHMQFVRCFIAVILRVSTQPAQYTPRDRKVLQRCTYFSDVSGPHYYLCFAPGIIPGDLVLEDNGASVLLGVRPPSNSLVTDYTVCSLVTRSHQLHLQGNRQQKFS